MILLEWLPFDRSMWIAGGLSVAQALALLCLGLLGGRLAHKAVYRLLRGSAFSAALVSFLSGVARYLAYAAAAIAALERVGVETTSFVALLASAGLAVGLALQGSLSHFASGVLILVFRPFDLGDLVQVGGHLGWVEDIGIFATTLVTGDGLTITVPNASITAASIVNHTAKGVRRVAVDIGIASGVTPGPVLERLETVARRLPGLDPQLPVQAVVHHLGESWVTLRVFVWVAPDRVLDGEALLRRLLYEELLAARIERPFPPGGVDTAPSPKAN